MKIRTVFAICLLLAGCIAPALDSSDYRYKAALALEEAHSALEAARLGVGLLDEKGIQPAPVEVLVRGSEDTISGSLAQLELVKPPNQASVKLRDEVGKLLDEASSKVDEARLALQSGDADGAIKALEGSGALSDRIKRSAEELEG